MLKKLLVSASAAGLMAGAAFAVGLENRAGVTPAEPYPLAAELDYAGGTVVAAPGDLVFGFGPSAGLFPTGNVLVYVSVTGATFDGALNGSEVTGVGTSVISTGGAAGASDVTFLVSGADGCAVATPAGPATTTCVIDLPLELTGSDVTVSVGLTTDANTPVDNTSATNRVSLRLVDTAPAFQMAFVADTAASTARLTTLPTPFLDFAPGTATTLLGTYEYGANTVSYAPASPRTVNIDFLDNDVSIADVDSFDLVLSGTLDAFDPANGGDVTFGGNSADDVDTATDLAEYDASADFGAGPVNVEVQADSTTAIARSNYTLSGTIVPAAASPLKAGLSSSGAIQPISREGTQVTFPWTQTSTLGAASGTTSVYRIGNLDNVAAGAVFVEVKNATAAGYTNPGIVQLATSVPAAGELVKNSTSIEAAVGNYGRGDIEFTVEAEPDSLTARQFVVRNGVIQQVIGGNVDQDINN
jgi:hypothetical protein